MVLIVKREGWVVLIVKREGCVFLTLQREGWVILSINMNGGVVLKDKVNGSDGSGGRQAQQKRGWGVAGSVGERSWDEEETKTGCGLVAASSARKESSDALKGSISSR